MAILHLPKAQIKFKNFEGRETRYTKAGSRSFAIFFDDASLADVPVGEWNVKFSVERDAQDRPVYAYILVKVRYDVLDDRDLTPKALLTINGPTHIETQKLDQTTIRTLDLISFSFCDVTIHSQPWVLGGRSGVVAILDKIHVTV